MAGPELPTGDALGTAVALIDAANAEDPTSVTVAGSEQPTALAHGRLASEWVRKLDPAAGDEQIIAARAHHLRRWEVPRSDYPEGRAGYLRWRADQKRRHADDVAPLLAEAGFAPATAERVGQIIRKEGLGTDPAVQTHEDALCLAFVQTQLAATIDQLGEDKVVAVVAKTLGKMSPAAKDQILRLTLSSAEERCIEQAMASVDASADLGSRRVRAT